MQLSIYETLQDTWNYSDKRVMIGLSGGINSMAVLVYLAKMVKEKPKKLFLFYAHFSEHSTETQKFVLSGYNYAKKHFEEVVFEQTNNSVNDFFISQKMIPHPSVAPCTRILKIEPIVRFMKKNQIDVDLVGYVRSENRRIKNQLKRGVTNKEYLISHLDDNDCFSLVKKEIGWYPSIYDIKWNDKQIINFLKCHKDFIPTKQYIIALKYAVRGYGYNGSSRVFSHNNCLPCKNMQTWEYYLVKLYYPEHFNKAMETAEKLNAHWGRKADDLNEAGQTASCSYCAFD
ncbi:MAG: phosphoadenosine phosphosulfate reductase family protein [Saprospiraceae bacterium]